MRLFDAETRADPYFKNKSKKINQQSFFEFPKDLTWFTRCQ
jgi:hypothetical protein